MLKSILYCFVFLFSEFLIAQNEINSELNQYEVTETDIDIFNTDKFWRGADGAVSIDLENGKILWLFSDTFIDTKGTGKRENSTMINNTVAIQDGIDPLKSVVKFYWKGDLKKPLAFFDVPGETWFWTGHGMMLNEKLVVFLFEEKSITTGLGFETVGWWIAVIDNPLDSPDLWKVKYIKGPDTFGIIVGSSAVLKDSSFVYVFGVKEPGTHETYLLRFEKNQLENGDLSGMEWWINNAWTKNVSEVKDSDKLFISQTEFSVHFDKKLSKYIQIQTVGFGHSSLGYRIADQLQGPWSELVIFYKPHFKNQNEFAYTARAHPELKADGLLITYNVNNFDFGQLVNDETIYFPRIVKLKIGK